MALLLDQGLEEIFRIVTYDTAFASIVLQQATCEIFDEGYCLSLPPHHLFEISLENGLPTVLNLLYFQDLVKNVEVVAFTCSDGLTSSVNHGVVLFSYLLQSVIDAAVLL